MYAAPSTDAHAEATSQPGAGVGALTGRLRVCLAGWSQAWWPVLVVSLPIAWAAVRAAAGRWVPSGDDAYFTVRSRDVLTGNHPLLGAWSSGSAGMARPINNLGPIQLDLLAPFTRWTPMGGTAIGVAVCNVVAVVTIAWLVVRLRGRAAVLPAMAAVGLVAWTMGSEMLITPRQHQFLILPFLCLLVAAWATAAGDRWASVPAVVAASVVAQTHLSYPVLVAALVVVMIAGQIAAGRRGQARGGRRPLGIAGGLAVVLWSQTLIDEWFGIGNLGDVLFGSSEAGSAGLRTGARIVAGTLVSYDPIARPGYRNHDHALRLANGVQTGVLWVALVLGVAFVAWAWRRSWQAAMAAAVALVAVLAGVVNASMLPITTFGLTIMNYRWLWSIGAFLVMLGLLAVTSIAGGRKAVTIAIAALCVVPAIANLPGSMQHQDADRYLSEQANVAAVLDQLDAALAAVPLDAPVVVDESEMYFGHPYTYPVLVVLQQHATPFRFENPMQERRFGAGRVADGGERARLRLVSGDPARRLAADPNAPVVAYVDGDRPVVLVLDRGDA